MIRKGLPEDIPAVFNLIQELARYERAADQVKITPSQLLADYDAYQLLVAEVEGAIVGMALYFPYYSTWEGKCVYLEDIVVSAQHRRLGIGTQLWKNLVHIAREQGAARLMWQVLDWNEDAISFYRKHGCQMDNSWINCRLNKAELSTFTL